MRIPTKLSVEALELTWLDIQGPIDIINQLSLWIIQNDCIPLYRCGGISGPSFINMAFTKHDATRIITKLIEMKAKIV